MKGMRKMTLANMTQAQTDRHNTEHCKSIADTLEMIAQGALYVCPECGEYVNINDHEDDADLFDAIYTGDEIRCPECAEVTYLEQVSMYDWLGDALDYEYTIGADRSYRGCRVMVAFGGPTIYVNTMTEQVELYWWCDRATYPISREAVNELDACMEELYNC